MSVTPSFVAPHAIAANLPLAVIEANAFDRSLTPISVDRPAANPDGDCSSAAAIRTDPQVFQSLM